MLYSVGLKKTERVCSLWWERDLPGKDVDFIDTKKSGVFMKEEIGRKKAQYVNT